MFTDSDDEDSLSNTNQTKYKCPYCDKQLASQSGMNRHKKVEHPEMTVVKPTKTFKFVCHLCDGECRFDKEIYLVRHLHSYHGLPNTEIKMHKCPMCSKNFGKSEISHHYSKDHGINLEPENVVFSNFQGFQTWKERIEENTLCGYALVRGVQKTKDYLHRHFACRGTVEYSDVSKGAKRRYNTREKIGLCPSHIKVSENKETGECSVSYVPTHVGHNAEYQSNDSSSEEYCLESRPDKKASSEETDEATDEATESSPSTLGIEKTMNDEESRNSRSKISDTDSSGFDIIEEQKIYECSFCFKRYSTSLVFKRHMRTHYTESQKKTNKAYKFSCDLCNGERRFNKHYHLVGHLRMEHGMPSAKVKLHECAICNLSFQKAELYEHYNKEHNEKIVVEKLTFSSFKNFLSWKEKIEEETFSRYTYERGVQKTKNYSHHYFQCHRSGVYSPNGVGERQLKAQGSNKINRICTSSIKLREQISDGKCFVSYIPTHIGHDLEVCHLYLSNSEREFLKNKIENNIPFEDILSEVKNSFASNSGLQRIHLLTYKDLLNLHAQMSSGGKKHENSTINATIIYLGQNESVTDGENSTGGANSCVS